MTATIHTPDELARAIGRPGRPDRSDRLSLVPTMGALHEGHISLVRAAKTLGAPVVVSVFVNPLQFGPGEDLATYSRSLERDVELLEREGVDAVFAPSAETMYPSGPRTTIQPGPKGAILEGASRPGHFAGVLTVVAKLFSLTCATDAFFGEKDYQQLVLVREMAADLNLPVRVHGRPIVREPSGLALSSRNRYLSDAEREVAGVLSRALATGSLDRARSLIDASSGLDLDYLELRTPELEEIPAGYTGPARLLVAAKVGTTRLIDNAEVRLG
ncbi:pantoate--beta-alanine ligase [Corynebacterium liangguodongii]|uniref:Pantothenate synthetase n=1 Tax=Corynebacterium liangguodongii TaxID=2079535 RepID=A0A2S0WCY9_9CORY|nr:pantoate--beta-alanine ligase [Corynebacterium liangguodongii]AWB83631.1 pantoate--beta-alanine ligase [Corynebacterium liangguodongii]